MTVDILRQINLRTSASSVQAPQLRSRPTPTHTSPPSWASQPVAAISIASKLDNDYPNFDTCLDTAVSPILTNSWQTKDTMTLTKLVGVTAFLLSLVLHRLYPTVTTFRC